MEHACYAIPTVSLVREQTALAHHVHHPRICSQITHVPNVMHHASPVSMVRRLAAWTVRKTNTDIQTGHVTIVYQLFK